MTIAGPLKTFVDSEKASLRPTKATIKTPEQVATPIDFLSSGGDTQTPAPSPTNVPGKTPQEVVMADTLIGPKLPTAPKVTPTVAPERPIQTAEKDVIANFSKFLGREPEGNLKEGELAEYMRLAPAEVEERLRNAQKDAFEKGDADLAADTLDEDGLTDFEKGIGIEGYDKALADQEKKEISTEEKYSVPSLDEILSGFGIEKLVATDYSEDFKTLTEQKINSWDMIDDEYAEKIRIKTLENKNALDAYQARLIKLGADPGGGSFISSSAGEISRGEKRIKDLEKERDSKKGTVTSNYLTQKSSLQKAERDETFNVMTTNINNMFKGYDLATNIWDSFNKRDEFQRTQEQNAQQHLEGLMLDWAKLEQADRDTLIATTQQFVEQGLYDINNEGVVEMLGNLESQAGVEPGTFVDAAVGGYWNRMSTMALKQAQAEQLVASAEKIKTLLPLEVQKYQSEIAKNRAELADKISGTTGADKVNEALNAFGEFFIAEAVGEDKKIDTQKYNIAKNEFVASMDPKLKNEKYFEGVFYDYFPPTAFLNTADESAQQIIERYKENTGIGMITLTATED